MVVRDYVLGIGTGVLLGAASVGLLWHGQAEPERARPIISPGMIELRVRAERAERIAAEWERRAKQYHTWWESASYRAWDMGRRYDSLLHWTHERIHVMPREVTGND